MLENVLPRLVPRGDPITVSSMSQITFDGLEKGKIVGVCTLTFTLTRRLQVHKRVYNRWRPLADSAGTGTEYAVAAIARRTQLR